MKTKTNSFLNKPDEWFSATDWSEEVKKLQSKEKDIVDDLTKKYGEGSLDPTSGVFTSSGK